MSKLLQERWNKIAFLSEAQGPCWDGYERVPGTKEKEKGSCRKKGSANEAAELMETDEGNAFSGARQDAIDNEEDEFEVGDKSYKVTGKSQKMSESQLRSAIRSIILEACYNGRKVKLNKKMSNPESKTKKSKVYVTGKGKYKSGACKGQNKAKKVQFGDPNMRIKKSNPKNRKSFRARHKCDTPGPKDKARYWSCKSW